MKKAIILAAGTGRRLGPWGEAHPKALLPVGGVPLLGNCLTQLASHGIERVVIVVGHLQEQIRDFAGDRFEGMSVDYVVSERFATTNNAYSLWLAREHMTEDLLLIEADVAFEGTLIARLLAGDEKNAAAIAQHRPGMEGTVVRLNRAGALTELIEGKEQGADFDYSAAFKTVNIYRFGGEYLQSEFVPALDAWIGEGRVNDYYELILKTTLRNGQWRLYGLDCSDLFWYEIDDHVDRRHAEYALKTPDQRLDLLSSQHGSFWRHGVKDHTYLYNAYFPPRDMWRRMQADFEDIAKQYPAGQNSMADIASDALGLDARMLTIANGASELIRIMCGRLGQRIIVPVPSFNEYMNATPAKHLVTYALRAPDFRLDVDAFAAAAVRAKAEIAIVVSPNNPTSIATPRADLIRLCETLERAGVMLLLDESFVDFCDDPPSQSLIDRIPAQRNLAIVKSLSKAYGVCGIRLGYLYTGNAELAKAVRAELPIWNINGLAEQFLRHLPRYDREFRESCRRVREDREVLFKALAKIPGTKVYAAEGNFVFMRLPVACDAGEIVRRLFAGHGILVKDCSQKIAPEDGQYLRIASIDEAQNQRLVDALSDLLSEFAAPELARTLQPAE